jgi:hypothetical protein
MEYVHLKEELMYLTSLISSFNQSKLSLTKKIKRKYRLNLKLLNSTFGYS